VNGLAQRDRRIHPACPETRSDNRRAGNVSDALAKACLILEGKARGPGSGATTKESQPCLSASALAHNLRSTSNQQQAVRCPYGWSSQLAFFVGEDTPTRPHAPPTFPQLSPPSILPAGVVLLVGIDGRSSVGRSERLLEQADFASHTRDEPVEHFHVVKIVRRGTASRVVAFPRSSESRRVWDVPSAYSSPEQCERPRCFFIFYWDRTLGLG
jgi:hypothetical protein